MKRQIFNVLPGMRLEEPFPGLLRIFESYAQCRGTDSVVRTLALLLATHSRPTPKQAKEPRFPYIYFLAVIVKRHLTKIDNGVKSENI